MQATSSTLVVPSSSRSAAAAFAAFVTLNVTVALIATAMGPLVTAGHLAAVLAEDREIAKHGLGISADAIQVVPVDSMFAR